MKLCPPASSVRGVWWPDMNDRDVMQDGSTGSEARRKLLQKYLRGDIGPTAAKPEPIPRRQEEGPAPLSYGQEQIWLHAQLALDLPLYNEPFTGPGLSM